MNEQPPSNVVPIRPGVKPAGQILAMRDPVAEAVAPWKLMTALFAASTAYLWLYRGRR